MVVDLTIVTLTEMLKRYTLVPRRAPSKDDITIIEIVSHPR